MTLYDLHYRETSMENNSSRCASTDRTQVNTVCLMQGAMPAAPGEMGLDRMYAENNGIAVGDTVTDTNGQTWTVTGYVARRITAACLRIIRTQCSTPSSSVAIVTQGGVRCPARTADLELRLAVRHHPGGRPRREGRSHRLYESRQQNHSVPAGFCAQ